jgi:hypothetical protein
VIAIPRGFLRLKPVEAVQAWLDAAEIASGSLIRRIDTQGRVVDCPLTAQVVALRVTRRAHLAGIRSCQPLGPFPALWGGSSPAPHVPALRLVAAERGVGG